MSYSTLPTVLQQKSLGFLWGAPVDLAEPNTVKLVCWLATIRRVNKLFSRTIQTQCAKWIEAIKNDFQTTEELKRKYHHYKASPLLNALLTDYEHGTIVTPTFNAFTPAINRDILEMIKREFRDLPHPKPEEISTFVFPEFYDKCLVAACYNDHVPVSTVEKLMEKMTYADFATEDIALLYENLRHRKSVNPWKIAYIRDRNLRLRALLLERQNFIKYSRFIQCALL